MLTKGNIGQSCPANCSKSDKSDSSMSADFKMVFLSLFRGSVNDKLS